ncbi:MAG: acetate--CoA ligase family protein [Rhodobacteraceae bacterium]|nr:acetate--CoA ligase family protein [Paracoccaceae bacterium]
MFLAEYQAKELLAQYGVSTPSGGLARTGSEAEAQARELKCEKYAVKAQIRAGGRGEAGGVKIAASPRAVRNDTEAMLGTVLATEQTGPKGERVELVYIEAAVDLSVSRYLALLVDERSAQPVLLGSVESGVEFERKAYADPNILETLPLPSDFDTSKVDLSDFLARLDLPAGAAGSVATLIKAMARAARETDAMLIEINPLAIVGGVEAVAVDAKMVIDGNALYRHPEFESFAREISVDEAEKVARENEINFVQLDGDIGVVVNGAGLGLATNDMIIDAGGAPANFMDIRTTARSFHIAKGVQLLLDDPKVRVILVNAHGGGMTVCDTIAEGVSFAYSRANRKPPIVFRAAGQNAAWARTIMKERRLPFETCDDMSSAINRAIELAREQG